MLDEANDPSGPALCAYSGEPRGRLQELLSVLSWFKFYLFYSGAVTLGTEWMVNMNCTTSTPEFVFSGLTASREVQVTLFELFLMIYLVTQVGKSQDGSLDPCWCPPPDSHVLLPPELVHSWQLLFNSYHSKAVGGPLSKKSHHYLCRLRSSILHFYLFGNLRVPPACCNGIWPLRHCLQLLALCSDHVPEKGFHDLLKL